MGYIKKLKNNELVGGTDPTTIYPVTSTKAVFEEITNGNESSFKSQKTINGEHDDRIKDLENEMPDTVKSITINGGTKTYLPENGNVELTIYSEGGEDYPSIAEAVQNNADNIEAIQNEIGTDTTEDTLSGRIKSLENAVGTGGSVDQRISNAIGNINAEHSDVDPTDHIQYQIIQSNGEITDLTIQGVDIASADALEALRQTYEDLSRTDIIIQNTVPTTGNEGVIYRVTGETTYTDYMFYNGQRYTMATYDIGNLDPQVSYYTCTTLAATPAKTATGTDASAYALTLGGHFKVEMDEANTATSGVTLQVGSAAAKELMYNGASVNAENTWEDGEVIAVYYYNNKYWASNAQGGGGKAEKIKYNNSQSGLAAENVQDALDNSANKINEITAYGELALPALANGIFSFNDTACIWVNVNDSFVRKHCCYQRKANDRFLEVTANSSAEAKVVFLTTYNVVSQADMKPYLCAWPINIEAGSTHRFIIPDNCAYIVFNIQYKTTIYTPASVKIGRVFNTIIDGKLVNTEIPSISEEQSSVILGNGTLKEANNWSVTTFPVEGGNYVCVSGRSSGWDTNRAKSCALCACYDGNGVFIASYEVGKSTNYDETEGTGYIMKLPDNAAVLKVSATSNFGGYPKARVSNLGVVPKIEAMETELNTTIDNSMYMGGVEPTQVGYFITNNGAIGSVCNLTPTAAANWEYILTSCKEGDVFKIKGFGGVGGRLWVFLDKDNKILSQETAYDAVLEREIVAPVGTAKILSDYNTAFEHYFIRVTDVERSYEDKMTISQYGLESKLIQQTFLSPSYSDPLNTQGLLTLLHFSDLHGDSESLSKIINIKERNSIYIHDAIFTGDSVFNYYNDPMPFDSVDGAGSILNTVGNHDSWTSGTTDYLRTEAQVYATIMANHIGNWGVEYEANKPYYYKDYTTQGFRLIVLDSVHWHGYIPQGNSGDSTRVANATNEDASAQKAWLEATLASAKTANLAVVCAIHYPPITGIQFLKKTGFCTYFTEDSKIVGDGWYSRDEIFDCVDNFISGGGQFMCWLMGHTHYDIAGTIVGHPNQFVALIERAGVTKASPYNNHIYGTFTEYAANVITFDKVNSLVKITRVGNTVDKFMQSKETLCYDVANMKMIYNT